MGRKAIEINPAEMQAEINKIEAIQTFSSWGEVFEALCRTEWARNLSPKPLTAPTAYLKMKQFNLTLSTEKGKKGKKDVEAKVVKPAIKPIVKDFKSAYSGTYIDKVPVRFKKLGERALRVRSRVPKSTVKAICMECCSWVKTEVLNCTATGCYWHDVRLKPYQELVQIGKEEPNVLQKENVA